MWPSTEIDIRSLSPEDPGKNFSVTEEFNFSDQHPNASIKMQFQMEFYPKIMQPMRNGTLLN